ncbi:FlxA-like family protein [Pseudomonas folii]|uniref:FlxA-like family protein n=1 Tax=Pseudomonas folii TaxID=2762593 RepID=A0ABR7AWQ6_9PSED|nr:FlxA-like family protein [Pseudomonas folii]MBC3949356.1 FlxA-like family protein [Pseudomonas folii]
MTTINTSSLGLYPATLTATIKSNADAKASETESGDSVPSKINVDLRGNVYQTDDTKAGAAAPSSPADEAIANLQKQIKEVQKQLLREQQQLAAAQNSKGSETEKASRIMAIQQQISGTSAQLATLQASLLELMKGNIKTTA